MPNPNDKKITVYRNMLNNTNKNLKSLSEELQTNYSDILKNKIEKKEKLRSGLIIKIDALLNIKNNNNKYIMDTKISKLNNVIKKEEILKNDKEDIIKNIEIIKLKKQQEKQVQILEKQKQLKFELEKRQLQKKININANIINKHDNMLNKYKNTKNINIIEDDTNNKSNEELKKEIENKIYVEINKQEIEMNKYKKKLKQEEDEKINTIVIQTKKENELELKKYDNILKGQYDNIKTALVYLNQLGSQLYKLSSTKNPNALKFTVHKTLNIHKSCVNILKTIMQRENDRYSYIKN